MNAIPTLSLTEGQALTALRAFLLGAVAVGTSVIRAETNLVPEPSGTDFIVMTPLLQERLETNETSYLDNIVTGSIAPQSANFIGSIALNTSDPGPSIMTVTSVISGTIVNGAPLSGGTASGTVVLSQQSGTPGGIGVYYVSVPQVIASTTIAQDYGLLTVVSVERGAISLGTLVTDGNWPYLVAAGTTVTQFGTGTGGVGTYVVVPQQTVAQETLYAGVRADQVAVKWTVQLDIHGPASGNNTRVIDTLFRSDRGVYEIGSALGYEIAPLYCNEARQTPFVNSEQQYEYRWTMDAVMQITPVVGTPQQFFDQIVVKPIEVDATYPP